MRQVYMVVAYFKAPFYLYFGKKENGLTVVKTSIVAFGVVVLCGLTSALKIEAVCSSVLHTRPHGVTTRKTAEDMAKAATQTSAVGTAGDKFAFASCEGFHCLRT
jgi:hypothetical protein